MTGGEALTERLIRHGLTTIYALPGVQNDALFNAFYDRRSELRIVHTRHEQGAAYMALGAALATGRPQVCSVVPGPGLLNAGAALATAQALNAPVLFLVGQIPLAQIGRGTGALHEIPDQLAILRQLTRFAARIQHPAEVGRLFAAAVQALAAGRPGPVALEIPMDVLAQSAPVPDFPAVALQPPPLPVDEAGIERVASVLAQARAPLLFAGSGAQGSAEHVRALAALLQAPVVSYRTGRGVMDSRSSLSFVLPAARDLWRSSDAVLALGSTMRIPLQGWERVAGQKLLRIDVDPASHALLRRPDIAVTARLEDALPHLVERVRALGGARPARDAQLLRLQSEWRQRSAVLQPQISFLEVIREELGEHGILVDELTQVGFASRLVYPVYRPRTFLSTGYMGTLGWGFPSALGAKAACPDLPVVSLAGDGGFLFAACELATAVQHRIALVTVLFNNNQYGNVQQMQRDLYGGRIIASDLVNPDFVQLAHSFGARAVRAHNPQQLAPALREALGAALPTLIEVPVGDMPSVDQFR
ncbi:MAG: acetolactate synthase [Proteobacteria bacterium]|nr:acetolactate synthase [Pseudomonadota bacterium]